MNKKLKYIFEPYYPIIPRNGDWIKWKKGKNLCESCGYNRARVNLDFSLGTHRACKLCWDFNNSVVNPIKDLPK